MQLISMIIGVCFILYFLCIEIFTGHGTSFYFVWLIMGVILVAWSLCLKKDLFSQFPVWVKKGTMLLAIIGVIFFVIIEGMIVSQFSSKGEENLDYVIVLGAQLKKTGPSKVLQYRLDKAYEYLIANENTIVIVSGGQGSNEPDTEAQGMHDYLVAKGISPERIIKEDTSVNTKQNIENSSKYLNKETDKVGIITNDFHLFRAIHIAKGAGYKNVCGISAPSYLPLQPQNMLREFFGIIKDFIVGNLA